METTWSDADEIWLIGGAADDADALAASELAWRRGLRGGRASLDVDGAAAVVELLRRLAADGAVRAAHDVSVGGLGVALALLAIRSGIGARVAVDSPWPTAALFGERTGRVILAVPAASADVVRNVISDAGVPGTRIGVAGGDELELRVAASSISVGLDQLARAWRTPF